MAPNRRPGSLIPILTFIVIVVISLVAAQRESDPTQPSSGTTSRVAPSQAANSTFSVEEEEVLQNDAPAGPEASRPGRNRDRSSTGARRRNKSGNRRLNAGPALVPNNQSQEMIFRLKTDESHPLGKSHAAH